MKGWSSLEPHFSPISCHSAQPLCCRWNNKSLKVLKEWRKRRPHSLGVFSAFCSLTWGYFITQQLRRTGRAIAVSHRQLRERCVRIRLPKQHQQIYGVYSISQFGLLQQPAFATWGLACTVTVVICPVRRACYQQTRQQTDCLKVLHIWEKWCYGHSCFPVLSCVRVCACFFPSTVKTPACPCFSAGPKSRLHSVGGLAEVAVLMAYTVGCRAQWSGGWTAK